MGAFLLYKKGTVNDTSIQKALSLFRKRGFSEPTLISRGSFDCYAYPKLNETKLFYAEDPEGNYLVITGTLLYRSYKVNDAEKILPELIHGTFNATNARGAFAIIYYNASMDSVELIQDETTIYRLYQTAKGNLVTSSFLSALNFSQRTISKNALTFNLITGYQAGRNTWVNDISRVFPGDTLSDKITSRKYSTTPGRISETDTASLLVSRLKSIEHAGVANYFLGLSAGYDSRLMLSILNKNHLSGFRLFTFYKQNDPDLIYSQKLSQETGVPIDIIETKRGLEPMESIYEKCFLFFDGGVHAMMQYSKEEYSVDFRKALFPSGNMLQVSGVGGEIYRNYNHDPTVNMSMNSWIISMIISPWLWLSIHPDYKKEFLSYIRSFLVDSLQIQTERIDFLTRKKYYAEVFLKNWHSLRNSVENQFAHYLSPFINKDQINASYDHIWEHGYGGKYEASLINAINPALAKLPSNYGYSFDQYPSKLFLKDYIKAQSNRPQLAYAKGWYSNKQMSKVEVKTTDFEMDLLNSLKKQNLPLNIENLVKRGDTKEQFLSTAYSLSQLTLI